MSEIATGPWGSAKVDKMYIISITPMTTVVKGLVPEWTGLCCLETVSTAITSVRLSSGIVL